MMQQSFSMGQSGHMGGMHGGRHSLMNLAE
jgi:hypothetical protein